MTDRRALLHGVHAAVVVEFHRLRRHRAACVATFVLPVVIATIVVFALGSADEIEPSELGYVTSVDADDTAAVFVDAVVGNPELADFVTWTAIETVDDAQRLVEDGAVGAVIVIGPRDVTGVPRLDIVADEDPIAGGVAATIVDQFAVRAASAMPFGAGTEAVGTFASLRIRSPGGASLDAAVHWGPALGAFFVLLALGYPAQRQVDDRRRSILARISATPTSGAAVTIGRAVAASFVGVTTLLTMSLSTHLLFGRSWGAPVHVVLVSVATAIAVAGIASLVATVSTSSGQAQSLTAVVSFGLAMLGGSFTPLGAANSLSGIGRWTPTALSLDGFSIAVTTGRSADLVAPVAALLAIGVVLLGTAAALPRLGLAPEASS